MTLSYGSVMYDEMLWQYANFDVTSHSLMGIQHVLFSSNKGHPLANLTVCHMDPHIDETVTFTHSDSSTRHRKCGCWRPPDLDSDMQHGARLLVET